MRLSLGTVLPGTILLISAGLMCAQTAPDSVPKTPVIQPDAASGGSAATELTARATPTADPADDSQKIDKRIFGVLPNYRTANGSAPFQPISAKRKFWIAAKDSFDYPVYLTSAGFAALYQLDNQNPSYGQGLKGYARRLGSAYGDQAVGNLMTEGLMPVLLREDPRYFRLGAGSEKSKKYRTAYALRGVMWARNDRGNWTFNGAEWLGNSASVAISNLYYPSDTRNARDNAEKLLVAVATDAFSNVLKEFWPDIKQKFFTKKTR